MTSRRTLLTSGAAGVFTVSAGAAGLLTLNTGAATPASAQEVAPFTTPDAATLQKALDAIAATAASGVLAEARDARWAWQGSSGVAELGATRPVPATGRFRAGSVTKSFVATVVLQLVGERRIALDDPVERWLPGMIPAGDRITVHHLLQHTSGIVNYTNTWEFRTLYGTVDGIVSLRNRTWTPAELLAFTDGQPLLFEPGTSWTYSNTNYILLALIVQKATSRPYATEVERRILRPLGLHDTELPGTNANLTGAHPHGYLPREHDGALEPVDITVLNPTVAGASGELITTTTDLNRFYHALLTGRLLRPAQLTQMRTAWPTGRSYDYGLGLQTKQLANGTQLWGHEGDIFGYQTSCWTTEDGSRQLTVAATPWGTGDLDELFDNLVATAFTHS
jgi:D-alanyl-D-alanine carboxypeptidase